MFLNLLLIIFLSLFLLTTTALSNPESNDPNKHYNIQNLTAVLKQSITTDLPELKFPTRYEGNDVTSEMLVAGATLGLDIANDLGIIPDGFLNRTRSTFIDTGDLKPLEQVKWFHPLGVCAISQWKMYDHKYPLGGYFKPGTTLDTLVRFSSGSKESKLGQSRVLGFAAKVFPPENSPQPPQTLNLFTLDKYGFLTNNRSSYFFDEGDDNFYFTNFALPKTDTTEEELLIEIAKGFLNQIDKPGLHRPLYVISDEKMPFEIWYVPEFTNKFPNKEFKDFRYEITSYGAGEIQLGIYLARMDITDDLPTHVNATMKLGELVVTEAPFMSLGCDLELHFHHTKNIYYGKK